MEGVHTRKSVAAKNLRAPAIGLILAMLVAAASGSYTVKRGDTLSQIADQHGTSVAAVAEANAISDPNLIRVGRVLIIPSADAYVVQAGDTLEGIARRHGTTTSLIAEANGITNPDHLYVGTRLRLTLPAHSYTPPTGTPAAYVVKSGDTLGGIALRFGTSVSRLAESNGITNPDLIVLGATLTIEEQGFVCPVADATFFNDWGFPRTGERFHDGNDLFAPRGTPVRAPIAGMVTQVVGTVGGNQFNLAGDDGHLYIGTHLEGFGEGDRVLAGEVIGYVGDTGNAAGSRPHLHFEIHADGQNPVNPYPTLADACG